MDITLGKRRHLSRVATPDGHFVVLAIDHRDNLLEKLNQHAPQPLTDGAFTAFKSQVLAALTPYASGVLVDPAYGMPQPLTDGTIGGGTGLLAPLEVTDYSLHPSQRDLELIPDWSIAKMKRLGCDGVKMLLPFHPGADNTAKLERVEAVIDECAHLDIPYFLEPIAYSLNPEKSLPNAELLDIVVEMARGFSAMGVDVLKMQFPVDAKQSTDLDEWQAACKALDAACEVPWALLSAGVDFDTFLQQAAVACQAGASGVIVGRAVWAEAVTLHGSDRTDFLYTTAIERMQALAEVCQQYATPWQNRVTTTVPDVDWYERYTEL